MRQAHARNDRPTAQPRTSVKKHAMCLGPNARDFNELGYTARTVVVFSTCSFV